MLLTTLPSHFLPNSIQGYVAQKLLCHAQGFLACCSRALSPPCKGNLKGITPGLGKELNWRWRSTRTCLHHTENNSKQMETGLRGRSAWYGGKAFRRNQSSGFLVSVILCSLALLASSSGTLWQLWCGKNAMIWVLWCSSSNLEFSLSFFN